MPNTTFNIDTNPIGMQTEEQFSALHQQLQEEGDGTGAASIDSDALLQYFINDSNKVLEASDEKMAGVLSYIANRLTETHHNKIKPLYRGLISFAYRHYQQSRTIAKLKHEVTSFTVGSHEGTIVGREQVDYAIGKLTDIEGLLEDAKAKVEPEEKVEFKFAGIDTYVWNGTRDRIFRYWYQHRGRHVAQDYSNREIAKEMNTELGFNAGYAEKIISYVNRWFSTAAADTWLSGDYIMRTQMYFSYRGFTQLKLNYLHQPPSQLQIIALGQQLHISTKQQTEE